MVQMKQDNVRRFSTTLNLQRVLPRTISSISNHMNENAMDWGWQGFLAYGVQTSVVIVDTSTIQVIQTLCHHKGYIIKVKWRNTKHYHSVSAPYNLILATSDATGCINVWDIAKGEVISTLMDGNKPVTEMSWLGNLDGSDYLLATLQPPYSFTLWDTRSGTRIWKKSFTDQLISFEFDPFNQNQVAFHGKNIILFVNDFNMVKCTQTNGHRYFLYEAAIPAPNKEDNISQTVLRPIFPGDKLRPEDFGRMQDCKRILFHRSMNNVLLLVYSKEILFLDILVKQTIGIVSLDRSLSSLNKVISCWQSDVIYCLHESGMISAYFRHRSRNDDLKVEYKRVCASEPIRHGKMKDLSALTINPATEKHFAGIIGNNDTLVILKELRHTSTGYPDAIDLSLLFDKVPQMLLSQLSPSLNKDSPDKGDLKISLSGVMPCIQAATSIRMCPPLTTKNIHSYSPLLASSNNSIEIQIINVATGALEKSFYIHTCIVKGIEWTSLDSILSHGYQELTGANGLVRNELIHTNILTGCSVKLRSQIREESPIDILKVSYMKNYFIIVFANSPFELWDCTSLTLLRTISTKFPKMAALEWSPSSFAYKNTPEKEYESSKEFAQESSTSQELGLATESDFLSETTVLAKESMVFSDIHGQLFLFSVQGNMIKDGTKFPSHTQKYSTTSMAWKGFKIVASDTDGYLAILDLKTRLCRQISTHRGYIKKIKFAPGKDNLKLLILFKDGVDIWDLEKLDMVSQLLARNVSYTTKENCEIIDADWAASDSPMFLYVDGTIRVFDIHLKGSHSPLGHYCHKESVASPYLMNPESSMNLKSLMTHQPHKEQYSLNFTTEDGFSQEQLDAVKCWLEHLPKGVCQFLEECDDVLIRAVMTAYLFGDKGDVDFWTVAAVSLRLFSSLKTDDEGAAKRREDYALFPSVKNSFLHLGPSFYQLCTNFSYKEASIERFNYQLALNLPSAVRDGLVVRFAWIGELDRAIKLLLETDFADTRFHSDCLRACMMSAAHDSNQAQSTIKLVATNLIAAGRVFEGTELLCLIDKKVDACRYLQSHGFMTESIWVAKCNNFDNEKSLETTKKWVQHLIKGINMGMAILAYMSSGYFSLAVDLLVKHNYYQRSSILLDAIHSTRISKGPNAAQANILSETEETIYKKYIIFLHEIHSTETVEYYANKVNGGLELLAHLQASSICES